MATTESPTCLRQRGISSPPSYLSARLVTSHVATYRRNRAAMARGAQSTLADAAQPAPAVSAPATGIALISSTMPSLLYAAIRTEAEALKVVG